LKRTVIQSFNLSSHSNILKGVVHGKSIGLNAMPGSPTANPLLFLCGQLPAEMATYAAPSALGPLTPKNSIPS